MSISSLYDIAKQYADKIMLEQPSFFSGSGGSLTLITCENDEIIFGITSIRVTDGRIITIPSEYNAIASMVVENKGRAFEMVTISFYDYSVTLPTPYCLNLLLRANDANNSCRIATSTEESISALQLKKQFIAEQSDTGAFGVSVLESTSFFFCSMIQVLMKNLLLKLKQKKKLVLSSTLTPSPIRITNSLI